MEDNDRIWLLMARVLSGTAEPAERDELALALSGDSSLQQQFELLQRFWNSNPDETETLDEPDTGKISRIFALAEAQEAPLKEYERVQRRRRRMRRISISGVAVLLIPVLYYVFFLGDNGTPVLNTEPAGQVEASYGSRSRTILPDGSTVWLNAGSRLQYYDFAETKREVKLEGEAYFEVVKDSRPFIVHTGGMDIRVLGTAFNVKAYPDEATVETTLIHGSVELIKDDGTAPILMQPNQKMVFYKKPESVNPVTGSTIANNSVLLKSYNLTNLDTAVLVTDRIETAWIYNRLIFRGDGFEELARKLERWYNVRIIFEDEDVKALRFNGSFENETITEALKALQFVADFKFKINNHEIYIRSG